MDSYVVKVQNKGTIRRLTLARGELEFSYAQLQSRIRDLFQLHPSAEFELTYVDKDGDVVSMVEDEDLRDALVLQKLNPLRVTIENIHGGADDVKISSPVVQDEVNSGEVTDQQQQQQSIQGEQIAQTLPESSPVDSVANADPVINSGPAEKVSATTDGAPESNPSDASSPASGTAADAAKEGSPDGTTTTTTAEEDNPEAEGARKEDWSPQIHFGIWCDGCGMTPIAGPRFKSCTKSDYDLCLNCYEASGAQENEYVKIDGSFYRIGCPAYAGKMCRRPNQRRTCRNPADQRQNSDTAHKNSPAEAGNNFAAAAAENSTRVLHQGVQCDECGMVPIEGPRFRSSVRFNYDLCHSCFEKNGSKASEYSRIDRPFIRRVGHPLLTRQLLRRTSPHRAQNPLGARWVWVLNQMVPMLAVDDQVGAAEEKTPAAAGSRQAGAAEKTPAADSSVPVGEDVVNTPQAASPPAKSTSSSASSGAKGDVDTTPSASKQEQGTTKERAMDDDKVERNVVQIPVVFNTKEGDSGTSSASETQTPVQVEQNASSTANVIVNNSGKTAGLVKETVQAPAAAEGGLFTQEDLLAKLAAMGFEDPKLNVELLEKNNFDLRKTLDDLCAAEEWDPILGELQEMGFYDANLNRRLMYKNNGIVKRVVKELVQMYKGENLA